SLKPWTGDSCAIFSSGNFQEVVFGSTLARPARYPRMRIHDLRHAYAIRLAKYDCPMHHISEVLGHSSTEFTRRTYARFSPESSSRAVLRVLEGGRSDWHKSGTDMAGVVTYSDPKVATSV